MSESASIHGPHDPSKKLTHLTHWPTTHDPSTHCLLWTNWPLGGYLPVSLGPDDDRFRVAGRSTLQPYDGVLGDGGVARPRHDNRLLCITHAHTHTRKRLNSRLNEHHLTRRVGSVAFMPSVLWRCWLGGRKGIRPVKNWVVLTWLSVWSEVQTCICPADTTATHCLLLQ